MNDMERLNEMLRNSKEDAPVSIKMFREFLDNYFAHLCWKVTLNTRLLWVILAAIMGLAVANMVK